MNKKLLTAALLGGLALAQSASAQEFDDRWYLTGSAGFNFQDSNRGTEDVPFGTLGFGRFFSPNWSVDAELNYQNPSFEDNQNLNWSQYGASLDFRRHFIQAGRSWNPYLLFGIGAQFSEEEYVVPAPNSPFERADGNVAAKVGAGLQTTFDSRVAVRAELAYRADFDDQSINPARAGRDEDYFGDLLASIGVVIPLGPAAVAAPPAPAPTPVAPSCADLDDDGDGVNNCDDKCPGSQAGQAIGPDGCPVPVSIDLKGVNFDYDKATLRPDAVAILSEAAEILKRYPDLRVEVAGHTDSRGTDAYNQKLSERRAKAVYDYLTSNGIDASRLVGPIGYGESRPIAPNANPDGSDNPEGRAKNRRTELNVQN
ncbi:OmpA/MotB domain protein [Pseudoxanthomonas suwonensis 11-1]|uniref:OmpA/MotB domain protein n=1 Tax=Pseudoxanthomonas suwonensis (strain 11-1) TaxID=743721 RepID=E6WVB0_PSEUU|nr:OmpA family protein [Pseudoxanthomonas suwonensis]ADV28109.1 OmpA/MotB domain protein [Pseudoxanthomonas suwonensis 11-1]